MVLLYFGSIPLDSTCHMAFFPPLSSDVWVFVLRELYHINIYLVYNLRVNILQKISMAIEGTKSEDPGSPIITRYGIFFRTQEGYEFINTDGTVDAV